MRRLFPNIWLNLLANAWDAVPFFYSYTYSDQRPGFRVAFCVGKADQYNELTGELIKRNSTKLFEIKTDGIY